MINPLLAPNAPTVPTRPLGMDDGKSRRPRSSTLPKPARTRAVSIVEE